MSAFNCTDRHMDWEGIALLVKWCPSWNGEDAIYQIPQALSSSLPLLR